MMSICCGLILEYYEEILSHIHVLTSITISDAMWRIFDSLYEMFKNDGYDYFTGERASLWIN